MNSLTKSLLAIVLGVAVTVHFLFVLIYCFPGKTNNQKLNFFSNLYIYPVFHQNWELFVPAPNVERKLFIRYQTNANFSDWQDILENEILLHRKNRLLGGETKVLLLSNSLIYELNHLDEKASFCTSVKQTNKEFEVLQFEIEQYLKSRFDLKSNTPFEVLLVSKGNTETKAYYIKSLNIH